MALINFLAIDGNLVRDPEARYTSGGMCITSFSLAHNRKRGDKEEVYFFDVTVFGKTAEIVAEKTRKGASVMVHGFLRQERWEKEGKKGQRVKIVAEYVGFKEKEAAPASKETRAEDQDDIPF